jgi:hypothetical protein
MRFLEQQFIEQLNAEVDSASGFVIIGDTPFTPESILRSDPAAYNEAFQRWKSAEWLPNVLSKADEIIDKYNNAERFYDLVRAIERESVMPFIGSGMSNPSGFPLWKEFLLILRKNSKLPLEELEEILLTGDYELAASAILANLTIRLFNEQIEHTFRVKGIDEIKGAVRYLPELFRNSVITLNYDNVLETLYHSNGNTFSNSLYGDRIADFRRLNSKGERCLVKFHGDLFDPRARVLTKEEYEGFYLKNERNKETLIQLFKTQTILFLGCSLLQDRTMQLFEEIAKVDEDIPRHIAFLKAPDDEELLIEREHFLTDRSIFPIWYDCESDNCHDECVEALFVKILNELGKI